MIIGYARVSSALQDTAMQLDALKKAGCEKIFHETYSGASRDRPELERCFEALREGDSLVVWRLDRLGRSLKDLVSLVSELEERKIKLKSLTEAIDTATSSGTLVFHIFGALSEFERNLIRERTQAGLAAARARGRKGGRPMKMDKKAVLKARAMLTDPSITKGEVAKHFGVTRMTLNKAILLYQE